MSKEAEHTVCELLAPWIEGETEEFCRTCSLGTLFMYYEHELNDGGRGDLVPLMQEAIAAEEDPIKRLAEAMDGIKKEVHPELRRALESLDCMAQNLEGGDDHGD